MTAPPLAQTVADRAIRAHGVVSDYTAIVHHFTRNRLLPLADGPDKLHRALFEQSLAPFSR